MDKGLRKGLKKLKISRYYPTCLKNKIYVRIKI